MTSDAYAALLLIGVFVAALSGGVCGVWLARWVWLAWQPDDVALLTGLYVLASRAAELGVEQPVIVTDMAGERHTMTFAEFEPLMLAYGAARAALSAGGAA